MPYCLFCHVYIFKVKYLKKKKKKELNYNLLHTSYFTVVADPSELSPSSRITPPQP